MRAPRPNRALPLVCCAAAASVALGLSSDPAAAQFRGCELDDSRCISDQIAQQCGVNGATVDSCLAFAAELQVQHGVSPTTAIGATLGGTYFTLAEMADDDADEALYLARARETLLDVIANDEAAAEAYGWLAVIDWDSIDARIDWKRKQVAVDPSYFNIRSFVRSLPELRTFDAYLEAIDTARAAYHRATPSKDKWRLALLTLGVYQSVNELVPGTFDREADEFVSRVREDSNWELITSALAEPARDPASMRDALETVCQLDPMFGEEFCMRGIEATVQAAIRYPDISDAQILADAAAIGVMAAPRITGVVELPGGVRIVNADIGTPRLTAWLNQLVNSRLDSLVVLDAIANTSPDMNRRFEVRREIVSRNPNSGRARFDLAQQHFNRKEWEPAQVQLELARELLPPDDEFQDLVREYLFKAEYEIRARN